MAMHHTGSKGDIGVARATAEFISMGYDVFMPVSSTSPFDLFVYKNGAAKRVQVKYMSINENGRLRVDCERAVIGGGKVRKTRNGEVDLVCVFVPDTNRCYFLDPKLCPIWLRLNPPNNNQYRNPKMRYLADFEIIPL
jgi:hypothetical protein